MKAPDLGCRGFVDNSPLISCEGVGERHLFFIQRPLTVGVCAKLLIRHEKSWSGSDPARELRRAVCWHGRRRKAWRPERPSYVSCEVYQERQTLWTHFSVFEVWDKYPELEGLFRHIYRKDSTASRLNIQRGFKKARRVQQNDLRKWRRVRWGIVR